MLFYIYMIFYMLIYNCPGNIFLRRLFFIHLIAFFTIVEKQVIINMSSLLDSQFLLISLYTCPYAITHCLDQCRLIVSFEIWPSSNFFLFLKIFSPYKVLYKLVNFFRKASWDIDRDLNESIG